MNLLHLFDLSLAGRGSRVALEWQGREYTFGDLDARSNAQAAQLQEQGFVVGDRLCVYLPNCVEFIDLYLACLKLGIIFVPVNILYREREIGHIRSDAEPRAFISETAGLRSEGDYPRPRVALDGDSPAAIVYTSGTTGVSKGAILTHNNFASNAVNLLACWRITEADRLLMPLPLFHVHGLGNGLHCWLVSGCRMRLLERFEHAKAAAEFLGFRPTLFFGVPTVYVRLLDQPGKVAREIGSFARLFVSGSAPLPAEVLAEFQTKYGHTILERYGMTETLMNISNPYEGERRPGTIGFPLPGVSARIVEGEVRLKGPNLFAGYWKRPEATAAAFDEEGWFRTGDMGERSEDGYYTLLGRRSDLIISGGFNIYPREIEEFLLRQQGVTEAAVVGVADRVRGEIPVAYVVGIGWEAAVLEAACRAELASFKVPRTFIGVDSLPRTTLGKIQKHLLPY